MSEPINRLFHTDGLRAADAMIDALSEDDLRLVVFGQWMTIGPDERLDRLLGDEVFRMSKHVQPSLEEAISNMPLRTLRAFALVQTSDDILIRQPERWVAWVSS